MKHYCKIAFVIIISFLICIVLKLIFNAPDKETTSEKEILSKYVDVINSNTYKNLDSPYYMCVGEKIFLNLYENDNIIWVEDCINKFGYYEFEKTDYTVMYNGFISKNCPNRNIDEFTHLNSTYVFYENVYAPKYDQKEFLNKYGYNTNYYYKTIVTKLKGNLTHLFSETNNAIKSYTIYFFDCFSWDRSEHKYISIFAISDNGDVISSIIEQNGDEWIIPTGKCYANIMENKDYKYTYSIIDDISCFEEKIII